MATQDDELSEPRTPLEQALRQRRKQQRLAGGTTLLVASILLWSQFVLAVPVDYEDVREHFKYGSIGSDVDNGLPYWVWRVLPEVCPSALASRGDGSSKGYEAFGFVTEPGRDRPIGFSKRRSSGIDLVGLNCAVCHVGTVRASEQAMPEIVQGMPAHQLDLLAYFEFLFDCVKEPGFTVANVMAHVDQVTELGPVERLIYRQAIPQVREVLLDRAGLLEPLSNARFRSGKGRIDTFNPYKAMVLRFPEVALAAPGASDFPSIWNQRPRRDLFLHWDGNNNSLFERNISAAIGAGVTPVSLDLPRVERIAEWLQDLPPPKHALLAASVDQPALSAGKAIYGQRCGSCHGDPDQHWQSAGVGQVEPIEKIGTDPSRLRSYTYLFTSSQWTIGSGLPWRFTHFRKTQGYSSAPLDGIWARAPYLHNGSVPTLRDLLARPAEGSESERLARVQLLLSGDPDSSARKIEQSIDEARSRGERPLLFYRGDDVLDTRNVGLQVTRARDGARRYYLHDTTREGANNLGHTYGTDLSSPEKDQLLAYLKTL